MSNPNLDLMTLRCPICHDLFLEKQLVILKNDRFVHYNCNIKSTVFEPIGSWAETSDRIERERLKKVQAIAKPLIKEAIQKMEPGISNQFDVVFQNPQEEEWTAAGNVAEGVAKMEKALRKPKWWQFRLKWKRRRIERNKKKYSDPFQLLTDERAQLAGKKIVECIDQFLAQGEARDGSDDELAAVVCPICIKPIFVWEYSHFEKRGLVHSVCSQREIEDKYKKGC